MRSFLSEYSNGGSKQDNIHPGICGLHAKVWGNFANLWPGSDVSNIMGDISGLYGRVFRDLHGCATGKNMNASRLRNMNIGDIDIDPKTQEIIVCEPLYPFPPGSKV